MKRPLMGLGIALAAGVAVGWSEGNRMWMLLIACIIGLIVIKRWTESSYKYLLGLSVFFVVGFCRTMTIVDNQPSLESQIQGRIEKVQEKENVYYLFLKRENKEKILLIVSKKESNGFGFYKGQTYSVRGKAEIFEKPGNPGQFDEETYYKSLGVSYRIWTEEISLQKDSEGLYRRLRWLEDLKYSLCRFYEKGMGTENSGILKAAVLGERSGLDADLKRYYQANGWMHLITTSGLHLSFVAMNLYKRLRKMTTPVGMATWIALIFMCFYGYMTDFGDSMIRAMGMMALELISKWIGRRTDGWTSIFCLSGVMLMMRPQRFLSVGFWLTYAAVGGMEFGKWLAKTSGMKEQLWIQTGIFTATLPVLLYFMYEIPMLGFFYNFFMIPFISAIVPLAFAAGIVGVLRVPFICSVSVGILKMMDIVLTVIHRLPARVWHCGCPQWWQMLVYGIGIVLTIILFWRRSIRKGMSMLVVSCFVLMFVRGRSDQIVFVDVGQGDGICMLTETGQAILVDGGSSDVKGVYTYRLEPVLKYYGVKSIEAWFISHGDADHVSGIEEALENDIRIGHIFLPDTLEDATLSAIKEMAQWKGIPVKMFSAGNKITLGNYKIECLYPAKAWCTGNGNEDSMILNVSVEEKYQTTRILFTGDLGESGEQRLLKERCMTDVDVLKVAHHGSSGGTTKPFLEQIRPEWAIISCGVNNTYGHPHKETLKRLEDVQCQWVSTATQGAVILRMTKDDYEIYSYQKRD